MTPRITDDAPHRRSGPLPRHPHGMQVLTTAPHPLPHRSAPSPPTWHGTAEVRMRAIQTNGRARMQVLTTAPPSSPQVRMRAIQTDGRAQGWACGKGRSPIKLFGNCVSPPFSLSPLPPLPPSPPPLSPFPTPTSSPSPPFPPIPLGERATPLHLPLDCRLIVD